MRSLPLVRWGISPFWLERAHVLLDRQPAGARWEWRALCWIPVDKVMPTRPEDRLLCPDCAVALVAAAYPVAEFTGSLPLLETAWTASR